MAGRASIVGAAGTHVGKVREHNEDAHFFDAEAGVFVVCDGMGGHAAGEVASGIAIQTIREQWSSEPVHQAIDAWLSAGTPESKKRMLGAIRAGALAAHDAILREAAADEEKSGMGTTLVGALIVGNELVFAHAGDSRAYIVRDNIAMQLTEDHTLLARLLAAGIDVDVSGEGSRFRSMLTNALGIGQECKVATFVVPLADGDRFLLCSDGISEYVPEAEVGTVLTSSPSPARAAQKLIDLALERGGGDNATVVVIRVLEAGETPQPVELRRKDDLAIQACALWGNVSPQQRLRALRIAIARDVAANERLPAHTLGERVAWIIVEGTVLRGGKELGPGALLYPESLVAESQPPDRDSLAVAKTDVRGLVLRADDFREVCEDDSELGELLHETLGKLRSTRGGATTQSELTITPPVQVAVEPDAERRRVRSETSELIEPPPPIAPPLPITIPDRAPAEDDDVIVLTQKKPARAQREALGRAQTPPAGVQVAVPRTKTAPRGSPAPTAPAEVAPPPAATLDDAVEEGSEVDLGSELRADLGGVHEVPTRASTPQLIVAPIETRIPKRPQTDLEVEMEAVLELEADEPLEGPPTEMMAAVVPDEDDDSDHVEMTVSHEDDGARITETVTDTSSQTLSVTVEEKVAPQSRPITANDAVVVSGTINESPKRPRRVSED